MVRIIKIYRALKFIFFYIIKLFQANIFIAYDIVTPKALSEPGFIWVPVKMKTKFGLLLFSNLVSMTPGTLSIDYSEEQHALLVHYLYNKDVVSKELENIQNNIIELTG